MIVPSAHADAMARQSRIVVPDLPHHVTQRGNRRQPLFVEPGDDALDRDLMAERCRANAVAGWAYCLTPNPVDPILVPSNPDGLATALGEAHRPGPQAATRRFFASQVLDIGSPRRKSGVPAVAPRLKRSAAKVLRCALPIFGALPTFSLRPLTRGQAFDGPPDVASGRQAGPEGECDESREIHRAGARVRPERAVAGAAGKPPAVHPPACAQGPAGRRARPGGRSDRPRRRQFARRAGPDRIGARQAAQGRGRRRRPALSRPRHGAHFRHGRAHRREGGQLVRHRRAAAAGGGDGKEERGGTHPQPSRRDAADAQRRDRDPAQGPHRQLGERRERL